MFKFIDLCLLPRYARYGEPSRATSIKKQDTDQLAAADVHCAMYSSVKSAKQDQERHHDLYERLVDPRMRAQRQAAAFELAMTQQLRSLIYRNNITLIDLVDPGRASPSDPAHVALSTSTASPKEEHSTPSTLTCYCSKNALYWSGPFFDGVVCNRAGL